MRATYRIVITYKSGRQENHLGDYTQEELEEYTESLRSDKSVASVDVTEISGARR